MAGRWGIKAGPVSLFWYDWPDGPNNRLRVSVTVLARREFILWGGPLT